jgi:hypothetical protein
VLADRMGDRPEVADALAGRIGTDRRISETQDVEQIYVAIPARLDEAPVALRVSQPPWALTLDWHADLLA